MERVNRKLFQKYALLLCILLVFALAACSTSRTHTLSITPTSTVPPAQASPHTASTTLRSLAQARHFYIGSTVDVNALSNEPVYSSMLAREFNMLTPEVSMKFSETEPQPDVYTFAKADAIVAFAQAHQMQVRGHNLVWNIDLPAWLTGGTFTRDQLITILREHIITEVTRYGGQVTIWDVVNEAVGDNGALRDTIWLKESPVRFRVRRCLLGVLPRKLARKNPRTGTPGGRSPNVATLFVKTTPEPASNEAVAWTLRMVDEPLFCRKTPMK